MNSGIYILNWHNCDYYYYGSSIDLKRRRRNHLNRLKNGVHENFLLAKIYTKYGLPNFKVVEFCSVEAIKEREQFYLDGIKKDTNNLNLLFDTKGAGRVFSSLSKNRISDSLKGRRFSEQHISNLKIANAGTNNPSYGKTGGKNANAKKVINNESGEIYVCAKDAAISMGMNYSTLIQKLSNNRNNNTYLCYCGEISEPRKVQRNSKKQELSNLITN